MQTIEQVTKKLFSDRDWAKKCVIGGLITLVPIVNILAFGYLYRLFAGAKRGAAFSLPEWDDWKDLAIDGLKFFLLGVIFVGLPLGLIYGIVELLPIGMFFGRLPLIPALFFVGPLSTAALYLYLLREDFKDCFNIDALFIMLRRGMFSYFVPTLTFIGLLGLGWVIFPFVFFFGGVIYFYMMAGVYRELENR